jgi:hypothetical protein
MIQVRVAGQQAQAAHTNTHSRLSALPSLRSVLEEVTGDNGPIDAVTGGQDHRIFHQCGHQRVQEVVRCIIPIDVLLISCSLVLSQQSQHATEGKNARLQG